MANQPGQLAVYICDFCGKKMNNRAKLKHHFDSRHLRKVMAVCHQCGIDFLSKSAFNSHNLRVHESGRFLPFWTRLIC